MDKLNLKTVFIFLSFGYQSSFQFLRNDKNACRTDRGLECCYGYFLPRNGTKCVECLPGYYGKDCKKTCPQGWYGIRCETECNCPDHQLCDTVRGCILKDSLSKLPSVALSGNIHDSVISTVHLTTNQPSTQDTDTNLLETTISDGETPLPLKTIRNIDETPVFYILSSVGGFLVIFTLVLFISSGMCAKYRNVKYVQDVSITEEDMYDVIVDGDITPQSHNKNIMVTVNTEKQARINIDKQTRTHTEKQLRTNKDQQARPNAEKQARTNTAEPARTHPDKQANRSLLPPPKVMDVNGPMSLMRSEPKEYDYVYNDCDGYLNPYTGLIQTDCTDHFYHKM